MPVGIAPYPQAISVEFLGSVPSLQLGGLLSQPKPRCFGSCNASSHAQPMTGSSDLEHALILTSSQRNICFLWSLPSLPPPCTSSHEPHLMPQALLPSLFPAPCTRTGIISADNSDSKYDNRKSMAQHQLGHLERPQIPFPTCFGLPRGWWRWEEESGEPK